MTHMITFLYVIVLLIGDLHVNFFWQISDLMLDPNDIPLPNFEEKKILPKANDCN